MGNEKSRTSVVFFSALEFCIDEFLPISAVWKHRWIIILGCAGMSSEDLGACTIPLCGRLLQCQSVQQPVPCSSQCTIVNSPDRCLHAAGLGLSSQEPLFFESFQKVEGVKYPQSDSYEAGTILQDAKPNLQNSFHAPNGFSVFGMNPITSVCQMWAQDLREGRIKS